MCCVNYELYIFRSESDYYSERESQKKELKKGKRTAAEALSDSEDEDNR